MKKSAIFLIIFSVFTVLLILLVSIEKNAEGANILSIYDAFWYLIVTLSTIGYGDRYPITIIGKMIGVLFILSSLGVMGFLISKLTIKLNKYMEDKKAGLFGTKLEKHIVIIGYDKFSHHIMQQIVLTGIKVAVVTNKKDDLDTIALSFKPSDVFTLYTDLNNLEHLSKVNITKASKVFIKFDDDTKMLVYILHLKNYYKDLQIVVSLDNSTLKEPFKSAGVLYAVSREEIAANLVASYIFEPEVAILTEDIMSSAIGKYDFDIMEFKITHENPYIGKEYNWVFHDMKKKFSSILLGIFHENKLYKNPTKEIIIKEGDYLIMLSNGEGESKVKKAFKTDQGHFL
ncbi:MAG: hypothetical protein GQ527_10735 [Bacteroidales bacterium]|nr:hypothetical protein [Bacteroidales bacterium]